MNEKEKQEKLESDAFYKKMCPVSDFLTTKLGNFADKHSFLVILLFIILIFTAPIIIGIFLGILVLETTFGVIRITMNDKDNNNK